MFSGEFTEDVRNALMSTFSNTLDVLTHSSTTSDHHSWSVFTLLVLFWAADVCFLDAWCRGTVNEVGMITSLGENTN